MNKPLTIIIKETKAKLINICNESGLSPVVLDLILQGIYSEVHTLAEQQTIADEKIYIEAMTTKDKNISNKINDLGDANESK